MPIFEYQCQQCGHQVAKLQKLSDAPLRTCPSCAAEALSKLISVPGFRLKGSGWYETDFKSGPKKNLAAPECGGQGGCAGCPVGD
ncbi:zinc ribbon domain-containing protein [Pseudaeromonas sp. ZJS20]|uniref:FmdB family zinc ribbon protein n=1 Tax=Pseudaeromonas aegiceratis TaxID=3153928 RepID=UPI00390C6CA6